MDASHGGLGITFKFPMPAKGGDGYVEMPFPASKAARTTDGGAAEAPTSSGGKQTKACLPPFPCRFSPCAS